MVKKDSLLLILGNQLFDFKYYKDLSPLVFMCEDHELCTHFKYHKHKIIHFLTSMRNYRDYLEDKGKTVFYSKFQTKTSFLENLEKIVLKNNIKEIQVYEIEDFFFEKTILSFVDKKKLSLKYLKSPMFLNSRTEFKDYLDRHKKPFMNSFYIEQRKNLNILMDGEGPEGGKWSFDSENRKKIPKSFELDIFLPPAVKYNHLEEVKEITQKYFSDHPGEVDNFWIPCNRKDSISWFKKYLKTRFAHFGEFQDALEPKAPFLYHSLISPLVNIGFLKPGEIVREVLKYKTQDNLNSIEGFIRQVIGWREFVRGIYQNFDDKQQELNFFKHKRQLTEHWYQGNSGVPPLDDAILKAKEYGYCHHIERLMVIGNLMLLLEIHPKEVYRWFMEMFVDSSDWVMGPNVFGMSQYSDGGIFATKPYICGSNYIRKMSHYSKGEWCDGVDGLYWRFVEKNKNLFLKNPRMGMMVRTLEKMDESRKKKIFKAAKDLQSKITKL
jgi:deoxyribodipyrimidine photolyase-related protein